MYYIYIYIYIYINIYIYIYVEYDETFFYNLFNLIKIKINKYILIILIIS